MILYEAHYILDKVFCLKRIKRKENVYFQPLFAQLLTLPEFSNKKASKEVFLWKTFLTLGLFVFGSVNFLTVWKNILKQKSKMVNKNWRNVLKTFFMNIQLICLASNFFYFPIFYLKRFGVWNCVLMINETRISRLRNIEEIQ